MNLKQLFKDIELFIPAFICITIAAMLNAGMDTLAHHFTISIFAQLNPDWWNPAVSWQFKGFIVTMDAWHLFKSGMLLFIFLYGVLMAKAGDWTIFEFFFDPEKNENKLWWPFTKSRNTREATNTFAKWYHLTICFVISWGLWVLFFNLFYDVILLSKTWSWL